MAIVVDEYGGVAGPRDDRGRARADRRRDRRRVRLRRERGQHHPRGRRPLPRQGADARSRTSTSSSARRSSDEQFDTVGGLVLNALGRLPKRGEQLDFAGFRFRVLRADSRRLHTLEVTRAPRRQRSSARSAGDFRVALRAELAGRCGAAARVRTVRLVLARATVVRGAALLVARRAERARVRARFRLRLRELRRRHVLDLHRSARDGRRADRGRAVPHRRPHDGLRGVRRRRGLHRGALVSRRAARRRGS